MSHYISGMRTQGAEYPVSLEARDQGGGPAFRGVPRVPAGLRAPVQPGHRVTSVLPESQLLCVLFKGTEFIGRERKLKVSVRPAIPVFHEEETSLTLW